MSLFNFHLPILFLLFSLFNLSQSKAPVTKIVFSKGVTPTGWEAHSLSQLTPDTQIVGISSNPASPYTTYITREGGFVIRLNLEPGVYHVKIGMYEPSSANACGKEQRIFTVAANGRYTPPIDIFQEVGCDTPYIHTIRGVRVLEKLSVITIPIAGLPPILSNIAVTRIRDLKVRRFDNVGTPVAKIHFRESDPIQGWQNPGLGLSPGVTFKSTTETVLPLPYRSYAEKEGGFIYKQQVQSGIYRVILGFAETNPNACAIGKRVFKVNINYKSTGGLLDIFRLAGCQVPLVRTIDNIEVSDDEALILKFITRHGLPPMISTLRIQRQNDATHIPNTSPVSSSSSSSSPVLDSNSSQSTIISASMLPTEAINPSVKPTENSTTVLSIDAGGQTDVPNRVFGVTKVFNGLTNITGTSSNEKFSSNRWGERFTYKVKVPKNNTYAVVLSFADVHERTCETGKRIFSVSIFDDGQSEADGQTFSDIDVFDAVGCKTAYILTSNPIEVGESGVLSVKFTRKVDQAIISGIDVVATDPTFTAPPSSSPSGGTTILPTTHQFVIDVGGPNEIPVPHSNKFTVTGPVTGTEGIPSKFFRTGRHGFNFTYSFDIAPGTYDIVLGYAETFQPFCSEPGKRVFDVYVNGLIQQEGFDIFAEAKGCFKGLEIKLPEASVSAVDPKPLTIHFESTANNADVKYISVKPAEDVCIPASVTGTTGTFDHAAHSVPGTYPPRVNADSAKSYVDTDGDGFVSVRIDGIDSHTHFNDPDNGIVGELTGYTWSIVETGEIISKEEAFIYNFPLGTTRLKLAVIDNSCTTHEAETTVTVTSAIQPGQYCYFYEGLDEMPLGGTLLDEPRPQFSVQVPSASLGFPSLPFDDETFVARCLFFLETDVDQSEAEIQLAVKGGIGRLFKGKDLIIDTETSPKRITALPVGLTAFEMIYLRTSLNGTPSVDFLVNGVKPSANLISYDRKEVLPILSGLTPSEGNPGGATKVKVTGYGLFSPLTVSFGSTVVPVLPDGTTRSQFFVESPPANGATTSKIVVTTAAEFESNSLVFSYGSLCDNVKFNETSLTKPDGSDFDGAKFATSAVIGNDGRIYVGALGGTVRVISYDPMTMTSTHLCYSTNVRDENYLGKNGKPATRDILGITFHPAEDSLSPYISTGTYKWFAQSKIDESNLGAWRNGAIDRLKPGTDPTDPNVCLVYDKRIVTGLPVSNDDHSVNGIEFTQEGDLLIAIGGFTNTGLPHYLLGNYWETTLTAAFLIAKTSKGDNFDGEIKYSNPDTPRLSKQISGDVEIYATGARNAFGITFTSSGNFYAADQGPNCGYGDVSISCSDYREEEAATYDPNPKLQRKWQGSFQTGEPTCPYSAARIDKILHITPGSWYGHPNIQRGDPECAWIDQNTHLTADGRAPDGSYKKPMTTVKSSVTGLAEYRSNHFCGNLRNQLILSSYQGGKTYHVKVNGGDVIAAPELLSASGGITFVEDAHGNLIFPRLSQVNVFAMKPRVSSKSSIFVANAVPFRHGMGGGKSIVIGGEHFGTAPVVTIGGKPCPVTENLTGRVVCTVPSGPAGKLVGLTVSNNGTSSTLPDAVLYMSI